MKSDYTIDFDTNTIYLSRSFAEKARKAGTPENQRFLEYKKMYRGFSFQKREFKKNEKQNRYKGMTYDFIKTFVKLD